MTVSVLPIHKQSNSCNKYDGAKASNDCLRSDSDGAEREERC